MLNLEQCKQLKKGDLIIEYFSGLSLKGEIVSDVIVNEDNLVEFQATMEDGRLIDYVVGHCMGPKIYYQQKGFDIYG